MRAVAARARASTAGHPNGRLLAGLLVSLLVHGIVLLLQFGVPGIGLPGASTPQPLTVRIAGVAAPSVEEPAAAPLPTLDNPFPPSPIVTPPRGPTSGMRLVDPVVRPVPSPPAPPKAKRPVKKGPPRRSRRISPPMPAPESLAEPSRVIAQDLNPNDFVVPLVRPEEAEQKTDDIQEARHGDDDGDAADSAALDDEARRQAEMATQQAAAARAAQEALEASERQLAEQVQAAEELKARQQRADQLRLEQQEAEQRLAEQRRAEQQLAERMREEQLRREQQVARQQLAEQRRAEQQLAEQRRAEQLRLERQRAEQQLAEQHRAQQQLAEQQRAEQQLAEKQRAEQQRAEQQRAELQRAAEQRAEQQRAEQQRAEQQRAEQRRAEPQLADQVPAQPRATLPPSDPGNAGSAAAPGPGGSGNAPQIPRNMMGGDLATRARELVKGIDVLRGDPPVPRSGGSRRVAVGAGERDAQLRMYVESWRQKIERNGSINYPRSWADLVRIDPLVSVAVRSDGTVEDVMIVVSSGRADMDDAVRRIVRINARYSPFPPSIAARYDVIDIRRVWRFDDALRLLEEVR